MVSRVNGRTQKLKFQALTAASIDTSGMLRHALSWKLTDVSDMFTGLMVREISCSKRRPFSTYRVFENTKLRRIVGHTRDEVTGDWRKLHRGVP
jgi:hypothetical protein